MNLEQSLFQLKFMAKSLKRQSQRASRDEQAEKLNVKKVWSPFSYILTFFSFILHTLNIKFSF